jgi:hypothetical protein
MDDRREGLEVVEGRSNWIVEKKLKVGRLGDSTT